MLQKLAAIALLLLPSSALAQGHALTGTWGGQGVSLTVDDRSARLQADCAQGHVDGPLTVDAAGRFSADGAFEVFHGPQLVEEGAPSGAPARFRGRVRGDKLELTISSAASPSPVTYALTRGARPKLVRCY